jgi:hypothetical protein
MAGVLRRRGKRNTDGHMKMEAELGVVCPKVMDCQESLKLGRGKEGFFPGVFLES